MSGMNYASLSTEKMNSRSGNLDRLSSAQIVRLMNREDARVLRAIAQAAPAIARAIELTSSALREGGHLIFVGAGTSGRLGVIEAAECPPTFGTPPSLIQAIMAGGKAAVFKSKEGAEDSKSEAASAVRRIGVGKRDVVLGIAASGVTPFVKSALQAAKSRQAKTILITCNPKTSPGLARIVISLSTGPEVLTGSTRLKAGSACKMALNILTTASMVKLGKVYGNRMVDLQPKSRKLVERGIRLIRDVGHASEQEARQLFKKSRGHVKAAIVMARKKVSYLKAVENLKRAEGFLRKVI